MRFISPVQTPPQLEARRNVPTLEFVWQIRNSCLTENIFRQDFREHQGLSETDARPKTGLHVIYM